MKKFVTAALWAAVLTVSAQANLMTNGGFEAGDTSDWWTEATGTATVAADGAIASEGTYSLLATSTGDAWAEEARFGQYFSLTAPSVEGDTLTLSFDYYVASGGLVGINFDYWNPSKHWLGWSEIAPVAGEWTTHTISYELPSGTTAVDLKIIVTGESRINFDNFNAIVPEPATLAMMALGGSLLIRRRR